MKYTLPALFICISLSSLGAASRAHAADTVLDDPKFNNPESHSTQISVTNDKSAIDVAPPYQPKETTQSWWDFGISTWSPSNLKIPTSNAGLVTLNTKSIDLYLNDTTEIFGSKVWSGKIGINWRPMELTVTNSSSGNAVYVTQSSQLVSIPLGVDFTPPEAKLSNWLQGYAGLAVLPSFVFTGRGGADSGSTYFGVLGEAVLGVRMQILKPVALDIAGMGEIGTINGSGCSGAGVNIGLRISQ